MLTGDSHVHSEWSWDTGGPLFGVLGVPVGVRTTRVGAGESRGDAR